MAAPDLPSWEGWCWDPGPFKLGTGLALSDILALSWKGREELVEASWRSVGSPGMAASSSSSSSRPHGIQHCHHPTCESRPLQGLPYPPALQPQAMGPRSEAGQADSSLPPQCYALETPHALPEPERLP